MDFFDRPLSTGVAVSASASAVLSLCTALALAPTGDKPTGWGLQGVATVLCAVAGGVAVGYQWASREKESKPAPIPVPIATAVAHTAIFTPQPVAVAHTATVSYSAPEQMAREIKAVHSAAPPPTISHHQVMRMDSAPVKSTENEEESTDPQLMELNEKINEAKRSLAGVKMAVTKGKALVAENMATLERLGEEIENRMKLLEETNEVVSDRWRNLDSTNEMYENRLKSMKEVEDLLESKRQVLADLEMRCQERKKELGIGLPTTPNGLDAVDRPGQMHPITVA